MNYLEILKIGLKAVVKATVLCEEVQKGVSKVRSIKKADRSPVTKADIGSQVIITRELLSVLNDIPIVGEEDVTSLGSQKELLYDVYNLAKKRTDITDFGEILTALDQGTSSPPSKGAYWTIDPIDGTKGFLRGEQYAVALALIEDAKVVIGILGCPNYPLRINDPKGEKGFIYYAVKGNGAFTQRLDGSNKMKISVDQVQNPGSARFCESVESSHVSHDTHAEISRLLGIKQPPLRMDSQCKYTAVARGDASIYLRLSVSENYRENIWDHAAGSIITTEAGGKVSDFKGKPLDFSTGRKLINNKGILVTNGKIHNEVLKAIKSVIN